ncbi:MAG TPA: HEPN domain-containing protein, partial [Solirubrobacteraceae bacterium]|nr:HEPN domain-containing protein [Solirubrobacteraceae bacterium]
QIEGGPLRRPMGPHGVEVLSVEVDRGVSLLLAASRQDGFREGERYPSLGVNAQWDLDPPIPVSQLQIDYIGPLQDLILFATRRQSYVTRVAAHLQTGSPLIVPILEQAYPRPQEAPPLYALALNLGWLDKPDALIAKWFALHRKVGPVWDQFFSVLDRPESILEHRLLALMSFAEGYHRTLHSQPPLTKSQQKQAEKAIRDALKPMPERVRGIYKAALGHVNSQGQRERLEYLTTKALNVLDAWGLNPEIFCKELHDTRNWMIHWGKKGSHVIEDDQNLFDLVRKLIVVMYVNLLLDLGVDDETTAKTIGSGWRLEGLP